MEDAAQEILTNAFPLRLQLYLDSDRHVGLDERYADCLLLSDVARAAHWQLQVEHALAIHPIVKLHK